MPIGDKARPRRGKHLQVLHRDLDLQSLMRRIGVYLAPPNWGTEIGNGIGVHSIRAFMLSGGGARGGSVDQPVTLDHMQRRTVRRAVRIDHGEWTDLLANRIDDERIALVMTDRIAFPGR